MAKITIPYFRAKKTAGGVRYYWEPSAELKVTGWKAMSLGQDENAAISAARARNDEVRVWRSGGARPRDVKKIAQRHTIDAVIAEFEKQRFPKLAENTRKEYAAKLRTISRWAGDVRIDAITRKNVLAFRDALYAPRKDGIVRETSAFNTLKVLRTLFDWAKKNELAPTNPAAGDLDVSIPAPRQQFASALARDALVAAADDLKRPNMAAAMILAWTIGQREEDLLKLVQTRYTELAAYEADDPAVYARIAAREPDGRVMGVRLRQGKTDRWVGVPVTGEARAHLEKALVGARALGLATILYDEDRERTWTAQKLVDRQTRAAQFQRSFAAIREKAAATVRAQGDEDLAIEIADLQFRDFRRTCVVVMGQRGIPDHLISAITGHQLDTVKKILETYLPRTTGMAMLAVDLTNERAPEQLRRDIRSA
ncbi:site-specific integrase [uncultured Sphingomonas sp.]|uniref:site-specific integrase n=1 Tax=uncultured Sphingomonas sp. TaxID=158754 RepID=UPI0030F7ED96